MRRSPAEPETKAPRAETTAAESDTTATDSETKVELTCENCGATNVRSTACASCPTAANLYGIQRPHEHRVCNVCGHGVIVVALEIPDEGERLVK